MNGVYLSLLAVAILTIGYGLVWLFCPNLHVWMESPKDRFLDLQRRFPPVVRGDASRTDALGAQADREDPPAQKRTDGEAVSPPGA
jgi:hypothetical protein